MKRLLTGLIIYPLISCHTVQVGSVDLLYQRWKSVDSETYLTFLPEGIILHGKDGKDVYCCTPRYFLRQGDRLDLKNAPVKTLPGTIREANCGTVRCASPNAFWKIVALDSRHLDIENPSAKVRSFKADP